MAPALAAVVVSTREFPPAKDVNPRSDWRRRLPEDPRKALAAANWEGPAPVAGVAYMDRVEVAKVAM